MIINVKWHEPRLNEIHILVNIFDIYEIGKNLMHSDAQHWTFGICTKICTRTSISDLFLRMMTDVSFQLNETICAVFWYVVGLLSKNFTDPHETKWTENEVRNSVKVSEKDVTNRRIMKSLLYFQFQNALHPEVASILYSRSIHYIYQSV